jgi:hypothetical protein
MDFGREPKENASKGNVPAMPHPVSKKKNSIAARGQRENNFWP